MPHVLAVAFGGGQTADLASLRAELEQLLLNLSTQTGATLYAITALTGGAALHFAEVCIGAGVPLQVLLPTSGNPAVDGFAPADRDRARRILDASLSVESIATDAPPEIAAYECTLEALQRSAVLITLDNDTLDDPVAAFARRIGRPILALSTEASPTAPLGDAVKSLHQDPELIFLNALPDTQVLPKDASPTQLAQAWFHKVDAYSSRLAPQTRKLASLPLFYTAIAALLSGLATRSALGKGWIAATAVLGLLAGALPFLLRVDHKQALWARSRTAAEVTRSALAVWNAPAGLELIGPEIGSELFATLMSLRFLKLRAAHDRTLDLDRFKAEYGSDRITGQRNYYARYATLADTQRHRYRYVIVGAIGLAVLLGVFWLAGSEGVRVFVPLSRSRWFALVLAMLFQAATIVTALEIIQDSSRRQRRYWELHNWLTEWELQLESAHSWTAVQKVVSQVEKALMVEFLEWRSLALNKKLTWK